MPGLPHVHRVQGAPVGRWDSARQARILRCTEEQGAAPCRQATPVGGSILPSGLATPRRGARGQRRRERCKWLPDSCTLMLMRREVWSTPPEDRPVRRLMRILRDHMPELRRRYGVRSVGVFGSYVRNEQRPDSDLDLLVEFEEVPGLLAYIELQHYLSDLLGVRVDLTNKRTLRPRTGRSILREAVEV